MPARLKLLFLCTHNSCRSQMAEAWAKTLKADTIEAHSAGAKATSVNPLAAKVMNEVGIDLSSHTSKTAGDLLAQGHQFDYVITVCNSAAEACPTFPSCARIIHRPFEDPPHLARHAATTGEALPHYRRIRDEIRSFIESLPDSLHSEPTVGTTAETNG